MLPFILFIYLSVILTCFSIFRWIHNIWLWSCILLASTNKYCWRSHFLIISFLVYGKYSILVHVYHVLCYYPYSISFYKMAKVFNQKANRRPDRDIIMTTIKSFRSHLSYQLNGNKRQLILTRPNLRHVKPSSISRPTGWQ